MDHFNTNIMNPVPKKVVFIGKAIASIKSEIVNYEPERVIWKADATLVRNTEIFAMDMKLVEIVITPALHNLENKVKCGQRRISSYS